MKNKTLRNLNLLCCFCVFFFPWQIFESNATVNQNQIMTTSFTETLVTKTNSAEVEFRATCEGFVKLLATWKGMSMYSKSQSLANSWTFMSCVVTDQYFD